MTLTLWWIGFLTTLGAILFGPALWRWWRDRRAARAARWISVLAIMLATTTARADHDQVWTVVSGMGEFAATGNECKPEVRAQLLTLLGTAAHIHQGTAKDKGQIVPTLWLDIASASYGAYTVVTTEDGQELGFWQLGADTLVARVFEDRVHLMLIRRLSPTDRGKACYVHWRGTCKPSTAVVP